MAVDIIARAMAKGVKKELLDAIEKASMMTRKIVDVLPTENIQTTTIYMVPTKSPSSQNIYDEYINIDGTINGWELIGTTEINLEDYVKKENIVSGNNIIITQDNEKLVISNSQKIIMDFPDWLVVDQTMEDLVNSLEENVVETGIIYMGGVSCSDLPSGMGQGELQIQVIESSNGDPLYYFTLISTNVSPYLWTSVGYHAFNGWEARLTEEEIKEMFIEKDDVSEVGLSGDISDLRQVKNKMIVFVAGAADGI